jgi:hypothetical protein
MGWGIGFVFPNVVKALDFFYVQNQDDTMPPKY